MMDYLKPDIFIPFFLCFVRVSVIIFLFPLLSGPNVPAMVKIGLSFFITIIVFPLVQVTRTIPTDPFLFAFVAFKEFVVGAIMGFIIYALFSVAQMTGRVISFPSGFMVANVFDPTLETQTSVLGQLFYVVAILIFFVIDGHHLFIEGIAFSFKQIALGSLTLTGEVYRELVNYGAKMFYLAVQIAGPVLISLLLTDIALGILARTIPQMNIFFIGLPLKLGLAIVLIMITMPVFSTIFKSLVNDFARFTMRILQAIG